MGGGAPEAGPLPAGHPGGHRGTFCSPVPWGIPEGHGWDGPGLGDGAGKAVWRVRERP